MSSTEGDYFGPVAIYDYLEEHSKIAYEVMVWLQYYLKFNRHPPYRPISLQSDFELESITERKGNEYLTSDSDTSMVARTIVKCLLCMVSYENRLLRFYCVVGNYRKNRGCKWDSVLNLVQMCPSCNFKLCEVVTMSDPFNIKQPEE